MQSLNSLHQLVVLGRLCQQELEDLLVQLTSLQNPLQDTKSFVKLKTWTRVL